MPGFFHFIQCIGKAVVKNGGKALASLIPFGDAAYEIGKDAFEDYRRDCSEAQLRAEMEQLVQAPQESIRQVVEQVAAEAAAGQPPEVRQAVAAYLNQVPTSIRQRLRRPADPSGTTVPAGLFLKKPEDLLPFLPAGLPRFKPGDRPLAADWELVELLGKGGFGEVWKARHLTRSRQKPVALKFCLDPIAASTLRNEATLHDHLDRVREEASAPGIVPLLETYLRNDPPCLMYEYIEGGDLAGFVHEMHQQGRMTPEFATEALHRLASIVAVPHRLSPPLVHRDLKPSNALVRRGPGDLPDLFVADFGIGGLAAGHALREHAIRPTIHGRTLPTAIRGAYTPLYASPQQVQGEKPDPRDDVHALGVVWYQLVTGDLKMLSIPPDWREVIEERGLGEKLIRLLASCISSRAEKRPANAAALAEELARCREVREPRLTVSASGGGTYRSISEALKSAPSGATIHIRPGIYREALVLNKPVTLLADGPAGTVVIESASADCILMEADQAVVRGFTLRCTASDGKKFYGVDIAKGKLLLENCNITSDSLACVAIHGKDVNPTIRNCQIHDSKESGGVYVYEQGKGTVEGCEIFANKLAGVAIKQGGDPTIRNCQIHDSKEGSGVYVYEQGKGTIEGCEIFANKLAGVEIKQGGDPTIRNCQIHDSKEGGGIHVNEQGKGTVEGCEIFANKLSGVEIKQGGDPTIRNCQIHDSKEGVGIHVNEQGKGTVEGCEIFANKLACVAIHGKDVNPTIRNCQIHDSKESGGVYVYEQGKGTVEGCEIFANKLAGVAIKQGGDPTIRNCQIHDSKEGVGIHVNEQGKGTVEGCEIFANKLSGVEIKQGGDPTIRNCQIHDSKEGVGIHVNEQGKGTVEGCEIFANKLSGVAIHGKDVNPTIRNCQIHDSKEGGGIHVYEQGKGTIEGCDIFANKLAGVVIKQGGDPTVRNCRVNRNGYKAVWVYENGMGTIEGCDLTGNSRGAWDIGSGCKVARKGNREA